MRNISDKLVEKTKHIFCVQEYGMYDAVRQIIKASIIWCKGIACWITKATDTHWEYLILFAFPQQQWLHKPASILRHKYTACAVELLNITSNDLLQCKFTSSNLYFQILDLGLVCGKTQNVAQESGNVHGLRTVSQNGSVW